jgi:hypothetical protein
MSLNFKAKKNVKKKFLKYCFISKKIYTFEP